MDKQTLLDAIRQEHDRLDVTCAGLDDDAWLAEAPGMAGWSRKDVLAHVGWWANHSAEIAEALVAGREPYDRSGPFDLDALNARVLEEGRAKSLAEVRGDEAEAYRRVVAAVQAVTEEDLFAIGRFAWLDGTALAAVIEGDTSGHWPEHLPHLAGG